MMTAAAFRAFHLHGMAASPFAGKVVLITGEVRIDLDGCVIKVDDNLPEAEEYGVKRQKTLEVQIPKSLVVAKPRPGKDVIEHAGARYTLVRVVGDEECSGVWVVSGSAPR